MDNRMQQQRNNIRSRQLNPCDHLFWKSRGFPERPYDWKEQLEQMRSNDYDDAQYDYEEESDYDEENGSGYYEDNEYEDDSDEYEDDEEDDYEDEEDDYEEDESDGYDYDHALKSNQNNPNNDEFWRLRGWPNRPANWKEIIFGY